jgi:polysaccharide biosynthesis protein PslH
MVKPRPRLLFLCHTLPYPPDSGMAIRSFNVLRLLARAFDVTALCFSRRKGGAVPQHDLATRLAALQQLADVEAFPVPQEHSRWRLAWDHLRSIGLNRAYTAFAYDSSSVAARIRDLLGRRDVDLVHLDSIMLSGYLPLLGEAPVVCAHPDIASLLLKRRALAERNAWRRAYFSHQSQLMEWEERRWCGRCQYNIVVSETDRIALQRIVPDARSAVVPNGVDIEMFQPSPGRDEGLVSVGELTWFPNRDALQYFCEEILPRIRAAGVVTPARWVGRASDAQRRDYGQAVDLTGYVADVRPYVRDAACYVVPLRVGGGTRVKILDAWAMGKAVVSTSAGCEGLAAEDGRNILIRDDPHGFAHAVCAVLRDAALRRRLGVEGRRTVERQYSWERIGESMLELYNSLPQTRAAFATRRPAEASA